MHVIWSVIALGKRERVRERQKEKEKRKWEEDALPFEFRSVSIERKSIEEAVGEEASRELFILRCRSRNS